MNLIVLLSAWILVFKILKTSAGLIDSFLAVFIFYLSQIIFSELVLGITGKLFFQDVIFLNLAFFLIVLGLSFNKKLSFSFSGKADIIRGLLGNKLIFFSTCILAGFVCVKLIINLANPPFGWDSLNYHFTFPIEWLKHGNLDTPITIADDPSPTYYPINGSLYYLWLILPLKNVFFADIGQFPFFLSAFFAVFAISRKFGANRELAFYAASLFFLIPNFFKQLSFAYVDVMVAAFFLICLNFLLVLKNRFNWQNVLIFSLSLGLFIGTKTIALVYGALLIIPFFYLCFTQKKIFLPLLICLSAIIVTGSFTYLRNFFDTANPFYPLNFAIFGKKVFKGVMDNSVYRAHFTTKDYAFGKLLFHEGLGAQAVLFILPSFFLALPMTLIKKKRVDFLLFYCLTLPVLLYLAYRFIIPLANTRYLYALFALGIIFAFYLMQLLNFSSKVIKALVTVSVVSSAFQLAKRQELASALGLTAFLLIILPFIFRYSRKFKLRALIRPLIILLFCLIFLVSYFLEKDYRKNEFSRYEKMVKYSGFWPDATRAWEWLNENTQGANIAYTGRPVAFPLYGSNFKNNVYYVSVNAIDPAKLDYFPLGHYTWGYDFESLHKNLEEENNYRGRQDYSAWLNHLYQRKTDYLFIYSLHQTKRTLFPVEDKWASQNLFNFIPVFSNQTIHIYRVKQ
ncbi:MAG: hypothetical protein PHY94_00265 [Candidatus Omnitrophica bacterium]|nr:hypothetical protein [Candidatus Omnitrophota bacterium]